MVLNKSSCLKEMGKLVQFDECAGPLGCRLQELHHVIVVLCEPNTHVGVEERTVRVYCYVVTGADEARSGVKWHSRERSGPNQNVANINRPLVLTNPVI